MGSPKRDIKIEEAAATRKHNQTRSKIQNRKPKITNPILASFGFAFTGLAYCFRTQRNFRVHLFIALLATILGIFLGLSWVEWAVIAAMIVLVLAAEMVNTMIESLVDLVTSEYHPLAKVAKDVAAGIVLLTAIGAVVVGLLIFGPRLLALLKF